MLEPGDSTFSRWKRTFHDRFGREPLYTHAYAYDMALLIRHAAESCPAGEAACVVHALRSADLPGVTGRLRFDAAGDLDTRVELGVYRAGRLFRDE
jgi:ABC-type branched-subunit amino acid transport system substrate-binding protein